MRITIAEEALRREIDKMMNHQYDGVQVQELSDEHITKFILHTEELENQKRLDEVRALMKHFGMKKSDKSYQYVEIWVMPGKWGASQGATLSSSNMGEIIASKP